MDLVTCLCTYEYIPGLLFFRRLWEPLWFDSFVKEILWKNKGRHACKNDPFTT